MKSFWNTKRIVLISVFLISAFLVFFVGTRFNTETMKREWILTPHGITHFRKGLDISGGTKLVYQIDYSKYKPLYTNQEFMSVKTNVEDIILKNIDARISSLGVSDYKSYTQDIDGQTQVVVEIGGVADLDQAKEMIGKTVELEFKIQAEEVASEEHKAERKALAEQARQEVIANPEKMIALYENKGGENIFAQSISGTLAELPEIYTDNSELVNTIALGTISEVIDGVYTKSIYQNEAGEIITDPIKGFVIFRVNTRKKINKTSFTDADIMTLAKKYDIIPSYSLAKESNGITDGNYIIENKNLKFNGGVIGDTNKALYDLRVIQLHKPETIGKSTEEIEQINTDFDALVTSTQQKLQNDAQAALDSRAEEIINDFVELEGIQQLIPDFKPSLDEVKSYSSLGMTYLVVTKNEKKPGERLYKFITLNNLPNTAEAEDTLKNQTHYEIDEIFIQDALGWKIAQGNDGSPLNGAYFTLAKPETTQFGEPSVSIEFNSKGAQLFCEVTSNNIGKSMGIFIGGVPATVAKINEKICDGRAQISGGFDREAAIATAKELNSGNMPAPLILVQEEKISPSLGDSAFQGALIATGVGTLAILLYLFFIYGIRKANVTTLTMIFFFIILLAILKIIDYALSLSGIAAIILSIGMAVDANILIFERMNEEVKAGKTYAAAIEEGVRRSWPAIRDGQISTLLIGILLFAYGINMFKGFGSMLIITTLLTLFLNVPFIHETLIITYKNKKN